MLYLHVPFCRSFCTYCGFYSEICRKDGPHFDEYAEAVIGETRTRSEEISMNAAAENSADTIYIGGGTPSVLPLDVLERIVEAIDKACGKASFREFTFEANPEDLAGKGAEYVRALSALGVNRFSLGLQSFDDGILRWMNRRHNAERAAEACGIVRQASPKASLSIDIIFGLSQLTDSLWEDTLSKAISLHPEHISAYQLSVEEGSALAEMVSDGRYSEASEEQSRRQYDFLCSRLRQAGYHHYEISNFALPGHEAVHNSAYWRRVPYVGLGPGAHSFSRNPQDNSETRSWNSQELPHRLPDGRLATYSRTFETLTPEDRRVERIMLPLRTDAGIPAAELYSLAEASTVGRLVSEGALETFRHSDTDCLRIPENRYFTSDEIIRELV